MASTLNADNGVLSGSAGLKSTADSSGVLALQTNGTTGLTINTSQAVGVGTSPSYGTSGQVLTSAGSAAAPTWSTPATGAMTLISSTSLSSTASVSITGLNFSTYKTYVVYLVSVKNSATTAVAMRVSTDNGSTWKTSGYSTSYIYANGTTLASVAGGTSYFQINTGLYSSAYPIQAAIYLPSPVPATASGFAQFYYSGSEGYTTSPTNSVTTSGSGNNTNGYGEYNAVQLYPVSGNFTSGYINVYGIT